MSYSSLIQSLPEVWRSSSGLAALASLGIHGLLLAFLPFVSLDSPDEQLPQNVPVVALTPEEQSRLPQVVPQGVPTQTTIPSTAIGQSNLPPLPPSNPAVGSDILPPLPPTPTFLPPPPPVNTPTYQYPISNSPPPSQIPTVPIPLPPPAENRSFVSQYPPDQLPPPEPNQTIRNQPLPPLPPSAVPPSPTLPSTTQLKRSEFSPPTANQPSIPQPNTDQSQNQVAINNRTNGQRQLLTPPSLPERTKQELIARRNVVSRERSANSIVTPNSDRQRLAALLQRRRQQKSDPTNAPTSNSQRLAALLQRQRHPQQPQSDRTSANSDSQRLAALLQRRQQQQQPQSDRTSTNSDSQRLAALLQRRQQQPNPASTPSPLSRSTTQTIAQIDAFKEQQHRALQASPTATIGRPIRYKIKTCNKQLDGGVAVLAALVNSDGKIISGPELLSKNSSPDIGRAAKTFVKEYSFPKTANPVNQSFRLDFSYDSKSCRANTKQPRSNS